MINHEIKKVKQRLREEVWRRIEELNIVRFPGAYGRIPNFEGCEGAAERVGGMREFIDAKVIKANPDSPQRPLRELCLRNMKIVYMAVPRLREEKCFIKLSPEKLRGMERQASTIRGAFSYGELVGPWEMENVDLVIAGCVAVNRHGAKVGKAGGYSDLEYAIGREFGIVSEDTPIITTVHPIQIIEGEIPMEEHDIPIDYIVTPHEIIKTEGRYPKPKGIYWGLLSDEKVMSIPILQKMRREKYRQRKAGKINLKGLSLL